LNGDEEAGGGVFPIVDDPHACRNWWNSLSEVGRAHWLLMAASAQPADAYHAICWPKHMPTPRQRHMSGLIQQGVHEREEV